MAAKKGKVSVTVDTRQASWGMGLSARASGYDREEAPWLHLVGVQGGITVLEAFSRGLVGAFVLGPTDAADESKPGAATVECGYWNKQNKFVVLGATPTVSLVP